MFLVLGIALLTWLHISTDGPKRLLNLHYAVCPGHQPSLWGLDGPRLLGTHSFSLPPRQLCFLLMDGMRSNFHLLPGQWGTSWQLSQRPQVTTRRHNSWDLVFLMRTRVWGKVAQAEDKSHSLSQENMRFLNPNDESFLLEPLFSSSLGYNLPLAPTQVHERSVCCPPSSERRHFPQKA